MTDQTIKDVPQSAHWQKACTHRTALVICYDAALTATNSCTFIPSP